MQAIWDSEKKQLTLELSDEVEAQRFHTEVASSNGFMVPLPMELALYTKGLVELRIDGRALLRFDSEVAQAFPLASGDWNTAFLTHQIPQLSTAADIAEDESETRGVAPVYRIQQMNPNEKARLASRAGRQERQILLRDSSPLVLQGLLANPRIEAKDILRIVKSTHANAGLLKRIAEDGRWGKNQEILASVAKNPKTPPPLATRLMDRLRTADLRLMGKMSSGLREDVRRAALREYLRRSGT